MMDDKYAKMANYVSMQHIQKKDANGMTCQYTYIINIQHAYHYYPG